ncbi:MAG: hypothetical protein WD851_00460 [Pirellulales bacterium]
MNVEISNALKGALFLSELKRRFFLEGFTLAIPEPDLGDDLWALDSDVPGLGLDRQEPSPTAIDPRFLRCQVKSARSKKKESCDDLYTVNFTGTYKDRFQQCFYYLIGLYDPDLPSMFHTACIPSRFFGSLNQQNLVRFNTDKSKENKKPKRPIFSLFISQSENYPKYTLRLKYIGTHKRGTRADLSAFFISSESFDSPICTMRQAIENSSNWNETLRFIPPKKRKRPSARQNH